jgi:2-iminobutanoate/2-iminopropanoate deaminase
MSTNKQSNRRDFLGTGAAAAAVTVAAASPVDAKPKAPKGKKVWHKDNKPPDKNALFNSVVSYGNLLFLSGVGAHMKESNDIKVHTKKVLDTIEENLKIAGSSMEQVLKAQVYLADIKDYAGMNDEFRGRFGPEPPVRTTVAVAALPGDSLVEIDVIAYI